MVVCEGEGGSISWEEGRRERAGGPVGGWEGKRTGGGREGRETEKQARSVLFKFVFSFTTYGAKCSSVISIAEGKTIFTRK